MYIKKAMLWFDAPSPADGVNFCKTNHVYKSLTMSRDYISEVVLKVVYVTWCRGYRTKGKEDPELYLQPQNLVSWHTWQIRTQLEQFTCLPSEWD